MYIISTQLTVSFVLPLSASPPESTTYDFRSISPSGVVAYVDDALITYTAPTATAQGAATVLFTPDEVGHWKFILTTGVQGDNDCTQTREIHVRPAFTVVTTQSTITHHAYVAVLA